MHALLCTFYHKNKAGEVKSVTKSYFKELLWGMAKTFAGKDQAMRFPTKGKASAYALKHNFNLKNTEIVEV